MWESRDHMIRWWGPEIFTCIDLDWELTPGRPWRAVMASKQFSRKISRMGGVIRGSSEASASSLPLPGIRIPAVISTR